MKLTHVFSIALLASCQAVPHSFQVVNASNGRVPPVSEDLTITMGDQDYYLVSALLSSAVELSGIEVVFDDGARNRLHHSVIELRGDLTIPADEVWTVTEHVLLQESIYLSALYLGETKMIVAHSADRNQGWFKDVQLLELDVEDLDYLAVHPAFLFSLTLELPHTDAHLATRDFFDRRCHGVKLRCTAVGKNTVLLEGLGFGVEEVARELLRTDEHNGRRIEAERKEREIRLAANSQGATEG